MHLTPEQQAVNENTSSERLQELANLSLELARLVAQNCSASSELLRELGVGSDPVVRQNLAMNPNTPPSLLVELAVQFPRHLFRNPAIDLILLENPNLLAGTSVKVQYMCSLVKRAIVPVSLLEYAANSTDERVQLAVAMNSSIPKTILERLAQSQSKRVVEAAQMHVNWAGEMIGDWQEEARTAIKTVLKDPCEEFEDALSQIAKIREFSADISIDIRRSRKVSYPQIPVSELEKLAQSQRWQERQRVANDPNTPAHILEKLVAAGDRIVFKQVAQNPNTPVSVLKKLLQEPDAFGDIASCVAGNQNTPLSLLEELASSNRHARVHKLIASHPRTPISILEKLANNSRLTHYVHEAIARNPNTPISLLEKLANHHSACVRVDVANNPKTPKPVVMSLLEGFERGEYTHSIVTNPYISISLLEKLRQHAEKGLETASHKDVANDYKNVLSKIARHPNISERSLRKLLLEHNERSIRLAAASNPNTPKYILSVWGLEILETMKEGIVNLQVLEVIAASHYTEDRLLQELVKHQNPSVRLAAATNPCAADSIVEHWESGRFYTTGEFQRSLVPEQMMLEEWEKSLSASSRLSVLLNSQAPVPILAKISRSSNWLERYAIASHSNTPITIRQRLTQDGNRVVSAAARANLGE